MPPSTLIFPKSIIQQEEENQLLVPSMIAAPLSPTMPLNSTYIAAHRSIPLITQLPPSFLGLSTLSLNTTTIPDNAPVSSIVQISNLEQNKSNHRSLLPPIESTSNRQDQQTSMTPTVQCSVSTQTTDDYYPTHDHCNDVSVCPCVQIYTRSEQLFMASMAIFFRNSITITPPEPSLTTITNSTKKNNKRQVTNHPQSTPIINEIEIETHIEKNVS
jgi:hypothetical protein